MDTKNQLRVSFHSVYIEETGKVVKKASLTNKPMADTESSQIHRNSTHDVGC